MFSLILGDFICCHLTQPHAKTKAFHHLNVGPSRKKLNYLTQKRDSLELRLFLYFSGLLNMWIEVPEQQLTWWLGSLHPYLATCCLSLCSSTPVVLSWHWSQDHHPVGQAAVLPLPPALSAGITREISSEHSVLCSPGSKGTGSFPSFHLTLKDRRVESFICLSLFGTRGRKRGPVFFPYSPSRRKEGPMSLVESSAASLSVFLSKKGSSWVVWKSEWLWVAERRQQGEPCSCGTPQALCVGQLRELSGPSLFPPVNNKSNGTNYSIHFSEVWIKINWTPELLLSCFCILCSPSAKLSYRLNFHSLLKNEPFKAISYYFSFPPLNMETPIRGRGTLRVLLLVT